MALTILSFVFSSIFTLVTPQAINVPDFDLSYCLYNKGNYTKNSDFQTNLNHVLSALPAGNGNGCGFYNLSYSGDDEHEDIDKVYAIGQCRGDVTQDVCRNCLENATKRVLQVCPEQKNAGGWYEYCMLRYSNRSLAGGAVGIPRMLWTSNPRDALEVNGFVTALQGLLTGLKSRAAGGGDLRKYAAGSTSAPNSSTIYALVQCTADVSYRLCNRCLDNAFRKIPNFCRGKIAGRLIDANYNFKFETNNMFFNLGNGDLPLASPPPESAKEGSGSNRSRTIFIGVSSSVLSLVLIILFVICLRLRKKNKTVETRSSYKPVEEIEMAESLQYNFETIRVATNDFSDSNKLGQGGFGPVYKGRLPNGNYIAVKRLSRGSAQGDLEFKNEVTLVAKLQHRNLVRLLGFCLEGSERLLVYELVPNGSLDRFIFDPNKRARLDWKRRYRIIEGIARGLLYLHEDSRLRIIHRDLKAGNILLDEEMAPKIADFGTAKLFRVRQTQGSTDRIVGTYGYMAPEYVMDGVFSVKSDVFSFGVLLLEILSGRKINNHREGEHQEDLLSYTWRNYRDGTTSSVADPLVGQGNESEIMRCVYIALLCVQENVANRPTMKAIVHLLNSNSASLPVPSQPAFFVQSSGFGSDMSLQSSD